MRKNGINRELRPIDGGVCAPEGYKANAVSCGIREDGGLDFAMILSERRCCTEKWKTDNFRTGGSHALGKIYPYLYCKILPLGS